MTLLLCESDESCYSGPYTAHSTDTIWTRTAQMNEARYWGRKHALCMTNPSQSSLGSRGIENLRFKFSHNTVPPSHLITSILVTCNVILSQSVNYHPSQYLLVDSVVKVWSHIKFEISFVIICILSLHLMFAIKFIDIKSRCTVYRVLDKNLLTRVSTETTACRQFALSEEWQFFVNFEQSPHTCKLFIIGC